MNHKWERLPDVDEGYTTYKKWECKTCGCVKWHGNYKYASPMYERSSLISEDYIECIDIEAENLKTID